jgi:hypothetical protein
MMNQLKSKTPSIRQRANSGMALVTVIIFSAIGSIVIIAALSLTSITSQSSLYFLQGQRALLVAEAGAENALMRLLRDPDFSQEVLTIADGTARIEVSREAETRVILVEGRVGFTTRKVEVRTIDTNGITTVKSWGEVF